MKFAISAVSNSSRARLGTLKCFNRLPDLCLETPMLFLYSKGGCVPHLTLDVLEMVTNDPFGIQLPLPTAIACHTPVQELQCGIGDFIGMKDNLVYCTVQDPASSAPLGYNMLDKVSIWTRKGKEHVDAESYMDIMEAFRPDIYQCLGDGETNIDSTMKRIQKSINRSLDMFHKCYERHKESEVLHRSGFLALLQGGYDISSRISYAKEIAKSAVDGFVIDGLHGNGQEVEFIKFKKAISIIKETFKEFPEDKFRVVHGCWSPEAVVQMVEEGVDAFDSSFPFVVTERGGALTFRCKSGTKLTAGNLSSQKNESSEFEVIQTPLDSSVKDYKYEINLEDKRYADDFGPLLKGCSCYCCTQHTRAYVHHLIINKELLARVLLTMHNLHHYLEFFKEIRRAVKENSLHSLNVFHWENE